MPIWLRNTTFKFISDSIDEENKAKNKNYNNNSGTTQLDWANPEASKNYIPDYYPKASKK
jgi:hypothetical protein